MVLDICQRSNGTLMWNQTKAHREVVQPEKIAWPGNSIRSFSLSFILSQFYEFHCFCVRCPTSAKCVAPPKGVSPPRCTNVTRDSFYCRCFGYDGVPECKTRGGDVSPTSQECNVSAKRPEEDFTIWIRNRVTHLQSVSQVWT